MCVYIGIYMCTCVYTHVCRCSSSFSSLLPLCRQLQTKASDPSGRASSDHGCHIVGREEAEFVVQAASPPGRVGAVQDLEHLSTVESQLVILEGLEVVQRPGPPHALLGKSTGVSC